MARVARYVTRQQGLQLCVVGVDELPVNHAGVVRATLAGVMVGERALRTSSSPLRWLGLTVAKILFIDVQERVGHGVDLEVVVVHGTGHGEEAPMVIHLVPATLAAVFAFRFAAQREHVQAIP